MLLQYRAKKKVDLLRGSTKPIAFISSRGHYVSGSVLLFGSARDMNDLPGAIALGHENFRALSSSGNKFESYTR